jgi:hypothetical protein
MANIVNLTIDDTTTTVSVTVQDGIISAAAGGLFIGGFLVKKGSGNVAATIEIDDYCIGWIGDTAVAGKSLIDGTPTATTDLTNALVGEAL